MPSPDPTYKWTEEKTGVIRSTDNRFIPKKHWLWREEVQLWIDEGNNPSSSRPVKGRRLKVRRWLNERRTKAIEAGVLYEGNVFAADNQSLLNLVGLIAAVNAGIPLPLPTPFTWRAVGDVDVTLSEAQLSELAVLLVSHVNTLYKNCWALKDRLAGANNSKIQQIIADAIADLPTQSPHNLD